MAGLFRAAHQALQPSSPALDRPASEERRQAKKADRLDERRLLRLQFALAAWRATI
jgi:hypothetical protein